LQMATIEGREHIFVAGFPNEWAEFARRNFRFLELHPHLSDIMNQAFLRTLTESDPIEKFAFGYGRLCCEDFQEAFLLCANGYGLGALKLLRTLYEHAVTLRYLHENSEELTRFYDYAYISEHKALKPILDTFGRQAFENSSISETEVESNFQRVRENFLITDCKARGTKRLNHTWNKLSFVDMAKRTGRLGTLIVPAYYVPLSHAHSSLASLTSRLVLLDGGGMTFNSAAQRREADTVLCVAHNIIVDVLEVQNERFPNAGLAEKIKSCVQDFVDIWKGRKPGS